MLGDGIKSRALKVVFGIIATIFLGAIGSGLWDVLLRHVFARVSDAFLSLASALFRGYVDLLYRDVSRNSTLSLSALPYTAIVGLAVFAPWASIWLGLRTLRKLDRDIATPPENITPEKLAARAAKLRRSFLRLGIPIALLSSIAYMEMFFRDTHAIRAELFIERSIEIVSSAIDEKERLQLRSQFRAIETAADFYKLEDRLRGIAKRESLTLPVFTSIK